MKDILITSSALILALLVLRRLFRSTLSRRVQYALWGLVLIRLLVPVSLPAVDFSVLTAAQPARQAVTERIAERPVYVPVARAPRSEHPAAPVLPPERAEFPEAESVWVARDEDTAVQYRRLSVETLLSIGWKAGVVIMGGFFVLSNAAFYLRLRKRREPFSSPEPISRKVYIMPDGVLPSPCLFGGSIYLTPAAVVSPDALRHVLAHEETHARHLDPLWALLRCVCLAVYWFDPFVWIAAACSKVDCELACDEGALGRLGEQERIPYGQTLLSLIPVRKGLGNPLTTATTMTADKRQLRERVSRIAHRPKQLAAAVAAALVLVGIASACTFTGANKPAPEPPEPSKLAATMPELGEPERVISLADAPLYTPEPYRIESLYEWTEQIEVYAEDEFVGSWRYAIVLLTSYEDQMQHFAVLDKLMGHVEYRCFLSLPLGDFIGGSGFDGELFGHHGPVSCINYRNAGGEDVCDYLYIAEDGAPVRLVQTLAPMEDSFQMDCDGDGVNEVVSPTELFFERPDGVHRVDIYDLWQEAYPAYDWALFRAHWDLSTGLLKATGYMTEKDVFHSWLRYLRFDGENLLVYRDPRTCADHVMSGIDAPEVVLDKAKELVHAWYLGTRLDGELYQNESAPGHEDWQTAEYDDWRVENLSGPEVCRVGGITLHAYQFNYEYHTATPRFVVLSGGMYITEDGWVKPGQGRSDYLFFRLEEDGDLTFLWNETSNDIGPEHLAQPGLERLGLLQNDPAYLVQTVWDELTASEGTTLNLITADRVGGGVYSTDVTRGWNQPGDITSDYRWETVASARVIMDTTDVLIVENGDKSLAFYQAPKLVEYRNGARDLWFRAEQTITDDVLAFELFERFEQIRRWYDEVEYEAMSADIVIPDRGQSREETVKEWTERYEGTHLAVTSGSKFKCTYIAVRDIETYTEDGRFPYLATIGDREVFRFWYSVIFVPESNETLNWMMAGNTAEYEGDDVPENAFQFWRVGHLYLADDGWRCEGVGTG